MSYMPSSTIDTYEKVGSRYSKSDDADTCSWACDNASKSRRAWIRRRSPL
jgi:hypothetical protein